MRWKLIRRRFSVSAPRMTVRSHLPWPLRWAVAALALGFSAALAVWAFEFGKEIAGLERDIKVELTQLKLELGQVRDERDRAQSLANAADSLIKAERAANERLALEMRQLEARKMALEADLGFFERLLPTAGQPLQLRALQAETTGPGQLRYQMLVMQSGKDVREFSGRYEITLTGTLQGKPWSTSPPAGTREIKLRQYARAEGLIDYPPDVVLKAVQAKVTDLKGAVQASGSVRIP